MEGKLNGRMEKCGSENVKFKKLKKQILKNFKNIENVLNFLKN